MKRFTKNIVIFGSCLLTLLFLFGLLLPKEIICKVTHLPFNGYGNSYTRFREADTVSKVDVLVLGSSHAYRSFDPRIFKEAGIRIFNLGSSSQSHIQTKRLLDIYLDKIKPKLIIYEVFYSVFSNDGLESQYDLVANLPSNYAMPTSSFQYFDLKLIALECLNFIRSKLNLDKNSSPIYQVETDQYIKGGYCERIKDTKNRKLNFGIVTFKPIQDQSNSFKENIELIRSRNISLLLIHTPIPNKAYLNFENREAFFDYISSFGNLINGNQLAGDQLNDSLHFYDNNHLNQKGVEIFNQKLLNQQYFSF